MIENDCCAAMKYYLWLKLSNDFTQLFIIPYVCVFQFNVII